MGDIKLITDGLSRHTMVAGQQRNVNAKMFKLLDCRFARRFDNIGYPDHTDQHTIFRKYSGVFPCSASAWPKETPASVEMSAASNIEALPARQTSP